MEEQAGNCVMAGVLGCNSVEWMMDNCIESYLRCCWLGNVNPIPTINNAWEKPGPPGNGSKSEHLDFNSVFTRA